MRDAGLNHSRLHKEVASTNAIIINNTVSILISTFVSLNHKEKHEYIKKKKHACFH